MLLVTLQQPQELPYQLWLQQQITVLQQLQGMFTFLAKFYKSCTKTGVFILHLYIQCNSKGHT